MHLMNLRTHALVALSGFAIVGCDDDSEGTSTDASSTTGDSDSDTSGPSSVSISVTATAPGTDPTATMTATMGDTDPAGESSDTDDSDTDVTDSDPSTTEGSTSEATDTGSTSGDTTGATDDDTIYEIQMGDIAEGTAVAVEGVVITGLRDGIGLYVQEPGGGQFSGVYVDAGQFDLSGFSVGDVVDVTGTTSEDIPGGGGLTGLTGIIADDGLGDVVPTGDTNPLDPEPIDFSDLGTAETAEPWESVLITVSDALVVSADDFDAFAEFRVEAGGDSALIDNFLYGIFADENAGDFPGFAPGDSFTDITGVLNFSFGDYKLAPRSAEELAGYSAAP